MEIFAALAGCVLYGLSDHAMAVPPLEAYGQLPAVELVRISPSGERIALIGVIGDERRLSRPGLGRRRERVDHHQFDSESAVGIRP
jgi:hypothetical protein